MPPKKFYTQLAVVSIVSIIVAILLHLSPALAANALLSWVAIAFYTLFCIAVFLAASYATRVEEKKFFTALTLLITVTKMLLSVIVVLVYHQLVLPTERLFVVPFLIVYVLYTIFETYFLMKLSRVNV